MIRTPQELAEAALQQARTIGMDDCVVFVSRDSSTNLRWVANTLTTNGTGADTSICIIAFVAVDGGTASGTVAATADGLDDSALRRLVLSAVAEAREAGPAADASPLARNIVVGNWDDPAEETTPSVFGLLAPRLGDVFRSSDSKGVEQFGYAEHELTTTWVASLGGIRLRFVTPSGRLEMTAKSHQRSRSTWEGFNTRTFTDVPIEEMVKRIDTRLDWQSRIIDVPAGRYDTILPSGAVGDMMASFLYALDGRDAFEGRSAFSRNGTTRIGEKIASLPINLFSDPNRPGIDVPGVVADSYTYGSNSVFDTGQLSPAIDWVSDGHLRNLTHSRATAREFDTAYTPDVANVVMELPGAAGTTDDLVKGVQDGLLLNCLWYIRDLDPTRLLVTGLTRDGVYVVKGGEVVGATSNFRFNESPLEMLERLKAVGGSEIAQTRENAETASDMMMPPMVIEGFNMSSRSDAS